MKFTKISTALCAAAFLAACSTSSPPPSSSASAAPAASSSGGMGASSAAAPASAAPSQNLVDPSAVQALKNMGTYLRTLQRYQVTLDLTGERVLQDGQKLMHSASADIDVAQPNRIKAATTTATSRRVLNFDGKKVSLLFPDSNYYSSVDYAGTVGDLVQKLRTDFGVELPAADLFVWGTPAAPYDNIQSAMNAGQAIVGGTLCDQYAFRQAGIDWQIWLTAGANPLPMKLVVTSLQDDARPQSVTEFRWNLKPTFKDSAFTFVPPAGAKAINMVPVKKQ
ncbi:MAG: DUF2092 domain-containing protein [Proteobacteria bacterium]|nr:DUF2092 domain-containing protein [Pseudomonadota bacterium]